MEGVRNDLPDQPLFIEWHGSAAWPTLHKNVLRDPTDNKKLAPSDFTPVERGHVYRYKSAYMGGFIVHMPYRVMDDETWSVLRKFESVRSMEPLYKIPLSQKRKNTPYHIWHTFYLDDDDFALFRKAAQTAKWEVVSGLYPVQEVRTELERVKGILDSWVAKIRVLRTMSLPGGMREKTTAEASALLVEVEDTKGAAQNTHREYARNLLTWRTNLTPAEQLQLAPLFSDVQLLADTMYSVDLEDISANIRSAIAGYVSAPVGTMAQLQKILNDLRSVHPVLNILSVDTEQGVLVVTAGGGRLTYDGTTTIVQAPFVSAHEPTSTGGRKAGLLGRISVIE